MMDTTSFIAASPYFVDFFDLIVHIVFLDTDEHSQSIFNDSFIALDPTYSPDNELVNFHTVSSVVVQFRFVSQDHSRFVLSK